MNRNRKNPGKELASTQSTPQPVEMALESVIVDRACDICQIGANSSYTIQNIPLSDVTPIEGVDVAIFLVGDVTIESLMRKCSELSMTYESYKFISDYSSDIKVIMSYRRNEVLDDELCSSNKYYYYWIQELNKNHKKG